MFRARCSRIGDWPYRRGSTKPTPLDLTWHLIRLNRMSRSIHRLPSPESESTHATVSTGPSRH